MDYESETARQPAARFAPLPRTSSRWRLDGRKAKRCILAATLLVTATTVGVRADVFYLKSGGRIEGDLVDETGETIRVMVTNGAVVLSRNDVAREEASPTTLQRYEAEKAKHPDTAEGEYDLGVWCDQNGLAAEARTHYRAAIAKAPELTAAYRALGYVPVGDAWLDGSSPAQGCKTTGGPAEGEPPLLGEIINEWSRRVHAIRYTRLDPPSDRPGGPDERKFAEGRNEVLAIKDPLAIPALVRVLSEGTYRCRRLLVEALGRFPQDEATLNLLAIALLDPDPSIRSAAAAELPPRKDPRVEEPLRRVLKGGDEDLRCRAAAALGAMKARSAVGDLVVQLTAAGATPTAEKREAFFAGLAAVFNKPTTAEFGGRTYRHAPVIAVCIPDAAPSTGRTRRAGGPDTTDRAEAQQALKAITGQDFGFDVEAWKRWDMQHATTRP